MYGTKLISLFRLPFPQWVYHCDGTAVVFWSKCFGGPLAMRGSESDREPVRPMSWGVRDGRSAGLDNIGLEGDTIR